MTLAPRSLTYEDAWRIRRTLIERGMDETVVATTRVKDLPALVKLAELQLFPDIERVEDLAPNLSWHTPRLNDDLDDESPDERMATLYAIDSWRGVKDRARHLATTDFNGLGGDCA